MSSLQTIILSVWAVIGLIAVYSFGAAWGGWRSGVQALLGLAAAIAWYGSWAVLIFFTTKAIFGF